MNSIAPRGASILISGLQFPLTSHYRLLLALFGSLQTKAPLFENRNPSRAGFECATLMQANYRRLKDVLAQIRRISGQ
jgi:hypothetical protein